jgi:hypothetical protein
VGLLLFVVAQIALYGLLWAVSKYFVTDVRSYLAGAAHLFGIALVAFGLPRLYFYFRQRGWTADVRMWASRVRAEVRTDWADLKSGWDIDLLRVQSIRRHERGTFSLCFALVGFHLHIGVLVDPLEMEAYRAGLEQAREAYIQSLPSEVQDGVRDIMQNIPLEAKIEIGPVPLTRPDRDDDDDEEVQVNVSKRGGGSRGGGVH